MPEIGATKLAGSIGVLFEDVRRTMDEAKANVSGALSELVAEVKGYDQVAKAIRAERDTIRSHINDLLGNAPPTESDDRPTNPNGGAR